MSDLHRLWKEELVECIHFLHGKGWAPATSSNYSYRLPAATEIVISSSGKDKGGFTTEDLMRVNLAGKAIEGGQKPSAETLLHTLIYNRAPSVTCVLHTHSVYNTVLSQVYAAEGNIILEDFEVLKGLQGIQTHDSKVRIPIFVNSQDMTALSAEIAKEWEEHPDMFGFLLAGHGFYTWGRSIAEAKRHMEVFEFLLECFYKIKTFGQAITKIA